MKRRLAIGCVILLASTLAGASGRSDVRKQIESSLLVSGSINLDTAGHVERYAVDQPDKLPPSVLRLLESTVPGWAFEPVVVDGHPARARTNMSLRVVATTKDEDTYEISVRSAEFSGGKTPMGGQVTSRKMPVPMYPMDAIRANVEGTVYVVLKVGLDGRVKDAVAEQVNLRVAGNAAQMKKWRNWLSSSTLAATKRWTFNVPANGGDESPDFRSMRVPVEFFLDDRQQPAYGKWDAYLPGPRQTAPWRLGDIDASSSPDAMIAGGVYEVGAGPNLLTPLGPG